MLNRVQLLRNIGLFDSVAAGANIALARLTLVYAENGRGKTTLAAVLRSLATGNPIPITERRRLAAQHPPHIVLDCDGSAQPAMFQNNAWTRTLPNMVVFDDIFINENVYSGLAVATEHRQHLHELILGSQGVALNQRLQQLVQQIEVHNAALRAKDAAIPVAERAGLSVDDFCALPARADIDDAIREAERRLAASREQDPVRNTPLFEAVAVPVLDSAAIERILSADFAGLDAAAAARVQAHLSALGNGGEPWVHEGIRLLARHGVAKDVCPFCAQNLGGSPVLNHYRAYFSEEYANLRRAAGEAAAAITRTHSGDALAALERAVRIAVERRQFWSRFCDVPQISIDTAAVARDWRAVREMMLARVAAKQATPLEQIALSDEDRALVGAFDRQREATSALNSLLQEANSRIRLVKEQASVSNASVLAADLSRLRAVKARHMPATAVLCADYLAEKAAKTQTEQQRDQARTALDQYRARVFPGYQTAVNLYLQRFNAGFRLDSVLSANTRGGPTCTYDVVINNTRVPVAGGTPAHGQPSFHNTLSAGDRNTLALAFFFASLDQDPNLASKIVVVDDPISSLDEHRALTTVQEMRRLADRTGQLIVLSHTKPFLCRIWEGASPTTRAALEVARDGVGSTLRIWDVNQDSVSEHDRRHTLLREYVATSTPNNREVARAIRPHIEAYLRVACPQHFPPGTLLGPFRNLCQQRIATAQEILLAARTQELSDLVEYANRFHHDTNPAWETEVINDAELLGFVNRALRFVSA